MRTAVLYIYSNLYLFHCIPERLEGCFHNLISVCQTLSCVTSYYKIQHDDNIYIYIHQYVHLMSGSCDRYYQLGLAYQMHSEHSSGLSCIQSAVECLRLRISKIFLQATSLCHCVHVCVCVNW